MRAIVMGLWCWSVASLAWAGTICQMTSTGQVVESYSVTQPDGLCEKNLTSAGIPASDIAQITVTDAERQEALRVWREHPNNPDVPKRQAKEAQRQATRNAVKGKLGLTDKELDDLLSLRD